jgi:hypothetical protein
MTRRTATILAAATALAALLPGAAFAQSDGPLEENADGTPQGLEIFDATDVTLDEFLWQKRPVVVFADTPADPRFNEQMALLAARPYDLIARDVVVITDTNPAAETSVRKRLRPRGFQVTLLGKDGQVELRKPSPWSSRELSRSIDKMPLRQQEVREQKAGAG